MLFFNKIKEIMQKIKKKLSFIKIDFSFYLIFIIAFFIDEFAFYFWYVLFLIGHEFSHFFVAKKLGYYSKKIKLNFFGAVLEGDDDFLINDEIKIVLAGPLFNFFVIVFCYLSFWFYPESFDFFNQILTVNLALFVFNVLPVFPLDCGRFILLILSKKYNRNNALKSAKIISFCVIIVLFVLFLLSGFYNLNFSLGVAAVNLMSLTLSNAEDTSYKRQLFVDRKFSLLKKGMLERTIYVSQDKPLFSLFKFIDDNHFIKFVFLDGALKKIKTLDEIEFYKNVGLL